MASYLLYEILENIFCFLKDDTRTLHSCLLVRRSWCRSIVPILWSNPFKSVREGNSKRLMDIYLKFLPCESSSSCLKKRMLLKDGKDLLSLLGGSSNFTFDYPIYLKVLDCSHINQFIDEWSCLIISQENSTYMGQREFCTSWFSSKLIKLLMKKSERVETMILYMDEFHFNLEEIVGFNFLKTLHLDYCCDEHSLNSMQDKCQSIEELWISLTETGINANSLNKLILSQRGLKDFRLRSAIPVLEYSFEISHDLLMALMTQKDTLHTVQFFSCQFFGCETLQPLAECTKIQRLGFFNCEGMFGKKVEPLAVSLFNLQVLALAIYEGFSAEVIIEMIKNSQGNLKRISFPMATSKNYMSKVFCEMTSYSKNLIGITVCFKSGDNKSFGSFLSLLNACPNLEYLCVEGGDSDGTPLDFDEVDMIMKFERLAKIIPIKVHRLVFYNVSVSSRSLRSFLDNCVARIKYLGFYECTSFTDHHIDVIIEHARKTDWILKNLIVNWCYLVSYDAIDNARNFIDDVQFSVVEPQDMEFTAWLN